MSVPIGGGSVVTLAPEQDSLGGIAVDEADVYWTNGDSVMRIPVDGGVATTLACGQNSPAAVAVDATSVYWVVLTRPYAHEAPAQGSLLRLTPK
jgi:hypothetical protein